MVRWRLQRTPSPASGEITIVADSRNTRAAAVASAARSAAAMRHAGPGSWLYHSTYSTVQYSIAQYSTWLYHTPVTETEVRESARLATSSHAHHHPASSRGSPR